MKNYAEMSNAHIAAEVLKVKHGEVGVIALHNDSAKLITNEQTFSFDVNNWADAGPVIEENNIWIQPDMIGDGLWHCYDREDEFHSKHANPLRAAMIVFLMMKDAGK